VDLADGSFAGGRAQAEPAPGVHEALELRDGDKTKYLGAGSLQAV